MPSATNAATKPTAATAAPIKAYSYARFSNEKQDKGDSIRRQEAAAQRYATTNGLDLDLTLRYSDRGISAYRGKNAAGGSALSSFLEAVRAGVVANGSLLIVEHLDRLSRQAPWDALETLRSIVNGGVTVVVLSPEMELSRATLRTNPMLFQMVVFLLQQAHEESVKKAGRLREAWVGKRLKLGEKRMTSVCPAWLTLDKATGTFTVREDRADVVRRIFAESLRGVGQNKLAATLNAEGVPVFGEGKKKGKHWHRSYVLKLLRSETVVGTLVPHTSVDAEDGRRVRMALDPVPNYYPAIIDEETFRAVQAMRIDTKAPLRGRNAAKGVVSNLFGGLVRCARCRGSMTVVNKGRPPKGYKYLVCYKAKSSAGCDYVTTRYEQVEEMFLAALPAVLDAPPTGDSELDSVVATLTAKVQSLDDVAGNLAEEIGRRGPSINLRQKLTEVEQLRREVDAEMAATLDRQAASDAKLVARRVADLQQATDGPEGVTDRAHVNALLRQTFGGITLDTQSGELVLHWRQGGESRVMVAWPKGAE